MRNMKKSGNENISTNKGNEDSRVKKISAPPLTRSRRFSVWFAEPDSENSKQSTSSKTIGRPTKREIINKRQNPSDTQATPNIPKKSRRLSEVLPENRFSPISQNPNHKRVIPSRRFSVANRPASVMRDNNFALPQPINQLRQSFNHPNEQFAVNKGQQDQKILTLNVPTGSNIEPNDQRTLTEKIYAKNIFQNSDPYLDNPKLQGHRRSMENIDQKRFANPNTNNTTMQHYQNLPTQNLYAPTDEYYSKPDSHLVDTRVQSTPMQNPSFLAISPIRNVNPILNYADPGQNTYYLEQRPYAGNIPKAVVQLVPNPINQYGGTFTPSSVAPFPTVYKNYSQQQPHLQEINVQKPIICSVIGEPLNSSYNSYQPGNQIIQQHQDPVMRKLPLGSVQPYNQNYRPNYQYSTSALPSTSCPVSNLGNQTNQQQPNNLYVQQFVPVYENQLRQDPHPRQIDQDAPYQNKAKGPLAGLNNSNSINMFYQTPRNNLIAASSTPGGGNSFAQNDYSLTRANQPFEQNLPVPVEINNNYNSTEQMTRPRSTSNRYSPMSEDSSSTANELVSPRLETGPNIINKFSDIFSKLNSTVSNTNEMINRICTKVNKFNETFNKITNVVNHSLISFNQNKTPIATRDAPNELTKNINNTQNREEYACSDSGDSYSINLDDQENHQQAETERQVENQPSEYDQTDSKWTLKYRKATPGLVELIPKTGVYVNAVQFENCKQVSKNCQSLARMLMAEVFTEKALRTCSLKGITGSRFVNHKYKRPGLDNQARTVLLTFVEEYGIQNNWPSIDTDAIENSMRSKLSEMRSLSLIKDERQQVDEQE